MLMPRRARFGRPESPSDRMPIVVLAVLLCLLLLRVYNQIQESIELANEKVATGETDAGPAAIFQAAYIDDGACLHGTPYDPADGAVYRETTTNGHRFVTITPSNTRSTHYPILSYELKTSASQDTTSYGPLLSLNPSADDSVIGGPLCIDNH